MDEVEDKLISLDVEEVGRPTTPAFDPKGFDRVKDEHLLLSREEFFMVARDMLDDYELSLKNANDYQQSRHTFDNWLNSFLGFISW
jgi:hypothetical protein